MPTTNADFSLSGAKSIDCLVKLLDASLDVLCSIDEEGHFVAPSRAASKSLWGYEPEELEGIPYIAHIVREDRAKTEDGHTPSKDRNRWYSGFENNYCRKDGMIVPMVWSARWDKRERVMYCVVRDAREKQQAEKKLQLAKKKYTLQAKKTIGILQSIQDDCIRPKGPGHLF